MNNPVLKARIKRGESQVNGEQTVNPVLKESITQPTLIGILLTKYNHAQISADSIGRIMTANIRNRFIEGLDTDDKLRIEDLVYIDKILFDPLCDLLASEIKYKGNDVSQSIMRKEVMGLIDHTCKTIDYNLKTEDRDYIERLVYEFFSYV